MNVVKNNYDMIGDNLQNNLVYQTVTRQGLKSKHAFYNLAAHTTTMTKELLPKHWEMTRELLPQHLKMTKELLPKPGEMT